MAQFLLQGSHSFLLAIVSGPLFLSLVMLDVLELKVMGIIHKVVHLPVKMAHT